MSLKTPLKKTLAFTPHPKKTSTQSPPSLFCLKRIDAMFATPSLFGGLLWKIPWRLSRLQKFRHRQRLQRVDRLVATVDAALARHGMTAASVERWKREMPTEAQMSPKDKYTVFDPKSRGYRKGVHSMSLPPGHRRTRWGRMVLTGGVEIPKWTRISQRINPPGF